MKKARLITTLMVAVGCGLCLNNDVQATPLFEDGFDSYTPGLEPPNPPWVRIEEPLATVDNTIAIDSQSVQFLDSGSSEQTTISTSFTSSTSVLVEYYMLTSNSAHEGAFLQLKGDAGADYALAFSNGAFTGSAGYIGIHGSPAGWVVPELLPYSEDTWYYVRRTLNTITNTGLFYVEEVGNPSNNASHSIGSNYPNSYVDGLYIYTSSSQGADCYVDEILVTPEPATLVLLMISSLSLFRRK